MRALKHHDETAFAGMRRAGALSAAALDHLTPFVIAGQSTASIDDELLAFALDNGAVPAPLNYRGFPRGCCTSLNHVICHGIPSSRPLREGDILNIDVTLIVDGWHGDTSRMFTIGNVGRKAERLIEVTHEAMMRGIACIQPGATLGDIGHAIQIFAEAERCSVVRDFCGHGIGRAFHDQPNVLHYGDAGKGLTLTPGMFFTVEPMINLGKPHVKMLGDGWTAVSRDRSLSAQFEHTVGVTETGCEIFTLSPMGLDRPPYAAAN